MNDHNSLSRILLPCGSDAPPVRADLDNFQASGRAEIFYVPLETLVTRTNQKSTDTAFEIVVPVCPPT